MANAIFYGLIIIGVIFVGAAILGLIERIRGKRLF
jgi:hypothetical protein